MNILIVDDVDLNRTMLSEMLRRLSDIELNGEHTRLESSFIAGSRAMPIRFTPGRRSS